MNYLYITYTPLNSYSYFAAADGSRSRVPNPDGGAENFLDFGDLDEEKDLEEIKRKQDEEFDITGKIIREEKKKAAKQKGMDIYYVFGGFTLLQQSVKLEWSCILWYSPIQSGK